MTLDEQILAITKDMQGIRQAAVQYRREADRHDALADKFQAVLVSLCELRERQNEPIAIAVPDE